MPSDLLSELHRIVFSLLNLMYAVFSPCICSVTLLSFSNNMISCLTVVTIVLLLW